MINLVTEYTDGKRNLLPIQNYSKIVTGADGLTRLAIDPSAINGEYDLGESFAITAVDIALDKLTIAGDQRARFPADGKFTVENSAGNDGLWVVETVVYDSGTDTTVITVTGNITDATVNGDILIYELLLKPPVGVSVVLNRLKFLISEVDATGRTLDANITTENGTLGQSHLASTVSLNSATLAKIFATTMGASERLITNADPLYLRRVQADNGASLKAKLVIEGVAV